MMTTTVQAKPTTDSDSIDTPESVSVREAFLDAERARWMTVKEAAYVLRVSPNTLFTAIHRGQVALFAVGKSWRIHVDTLVQCQKKLEEWQPAPHAPSPPITPRSNSNCGRRGRVT